MSSDLYYETPPIRRTCKTDFISCLPCQFEILFLIKFSKKKFYILDRHREGWEVLSHVAMVNSDFWTIRYLSYA